MSAFQSSHGIRMRFERSSNRVDKKVDKIFFAATVSRSFAAKACLSAGDFKSVAYTNSAIRAGSGSFSKKSGGGQQILGRLGGRFKSQPLPFPYPVEVWDC